jgi:hypothetical protein
MERELYFQQMEAFPERRGTKRQEQELDVRIKEMHTCVRVTELKKEEEIQ